MKRIREVLVVEGRYDKIRLESVVDTMIIPLDGFRVFRSPQQIKLLRELAAARGLLVLTDSDSAGFVLRDFLSGAIPPEQIRHAYIPEIRGKEKRKTIPGREGLLGVEGMETDVLLDALHRAGATFLDEPAHSQTPWMTRQKLYEDGLAGRENSASLRRRLLRLWGYPEKISTARLVDLINTAKTPQDYQQAIQQIQQE